MNDEITKSVASSWGAIDSILTSVGGVLGSAGIIWWRQNRLERQQELQAVEDRDLIKHVQSLELKINETAITANTKAMEGMSDALKLIAGGNNKLAESVVNQTKLLDKMEKSIDNLYGQIRKVEEKYVSKDHFETFKENCIRMHK